MHNKTVHMIAFILVIIGGINWLLVGLGVWELANLTDAISPMLTMIIYILVGISAIYLVLTHKASCKDCTASSNGGMGGMNM